MPPAPATTSSTAERRVAGQAVVLRWAGTAYDCAVGETVLDALLRQGVALSFSCRKGACLSCLLRAEGTPPPATAQVGLRETLRDQGYFLPCLCRPVGDMTITAPDEAGAYEPARVVAVETLGPTVRRVRIAPARPFRYRAGQFVNLRRADGLARPYSIANPPGPERSIEIHVKRLPGGAMSGWVHDALEPGESVSLQGPNGTVFHLPDRPERNILMIGNGTGLAPLYGILRDALAARHRGAIRLYHGTRHRPGLYLDAPLRRLRARNRNFHYIPCLSGDPPRGDERAGRVEAVAFADLDDLAGWRVYLCGYPPMVQAARRTAYLRGAALDDIHADPFELRERRRAPRERAVHPIK